MFSSYLLNKTAELFIKFLHCLICMVGIATLSVWKPISMFTCGAVFLGVINLWKRDLEPLMKTSEILFLLLKKII